MEIVSLVSYKPRLLHVVSLVCGSVESLHSLLFQNIFSYMSYIELLFVLYKVARPLLTFCEQSTPMNPAGQIQVPLIVSQSPPFKHLQKFFDINQLYLINKNDLIRDIEECSTYIIDDIMFLLYFIIINKPLVISFQVLSNKIIIFTTPHQDNAKQHIF